MIDEAWLLSVHARLIAGDPTASAELAERCLDPLAQVLRTEFRSLPDPSVIVEAAIDALMDFIKHPAKFDQSKGRAFGYLVMAAKGDLRNALAKDSRRRRLTERAGVELQTQRGNQDSEEVQRELAEAMNSEKLRVNALFDSEQDRKLAQLVIEGVRSTAAFAQILQIEDQPLDSQKRQVKRHKDRIKKRLERRDH